MKKEIEMSDEVECFGVRYSSRDIAKDTGKSHKHVTRDIIRMCEDLGIDALKFEHIYIDSRNREQTEYMLDKNHAMCLAAGYSAKLRMKIITRLEELENETCSVLPPLSKRPAHMNVIQWRESLDLIDKLKMPVVVYEEMDLCLSLAIRELRAVGRGAFVENGFTMYPLAIFETAEKRMRDRAGKGHGLLGSSRYLTGLAWNSSDLLPFSGYRLEIEEDERFQREIMNS